MLTLLFIFVLLQFIFGSYKPNGVLVCGLFGGGFNRPIDESILSKIKILGYMNQSRGEHSCGYFNGEEIFKGIDSKKKFIDLVTNDGIKIPENSTNNIFIGHTRMATYGSHTAENAHPFEIDNEMVIAHNGTISNIWPLCTKNEINHTQIYVDSKGLGELLNKVGYKILDEYEGYAALLVHKKNEPNILYLYHGASKLEEDGGEFEERPLFYLKQPEGVYVSSLEYALDFIKNDTSKVEVLPYNLILRIKNGVLQNTKIKINRGNKNVKKVYTPIKSVVNNSQYSRGVQQGFGYSEEYDSSEVIKELSKRFPNVEIIGNVKSTAAKVLSSAKVQSSSSEEKNIDIFLETTPLEGQGVIPNKGKLYYRFGRYYIISGGGIKLASGLLVANSKTGSIIPLESVKDIEKSEKVESFYFYKGVLLNGVRAFDIINDAINDTVTSEKNKHFLPTLKQNLTTNTGNFANAISHYSKYPVCLLRDESVEITQSREFWYLGGKFAGSSYSPKFSSRDYHFVSGLLIKIKANNEKDKNILMTVVKGFSQEKPEVIVEKSEKVKKQEDYYDGITVQEVNDIAILFKNRLYTTSSEATKALEDVGMCALGLYVEELCQDTLKIANPTEEQTESLCMEIIKEAVEKKVSIEDLLSPHLGDIEQYIMDAMIIINQEKNNNSESEDDNLLQDLEVTNNKVSLMQDVNFQKLNSSDKPTELNDPDEPDTTIDMEEEINQIEKATQENEEAGDILDEVADIISDLYKRSVDLQLLNHSKYAQGMSFELQRGLDNIVTSLSGEALEAKEQQLVKKLKRINSIL